jgi:hypothetical protein
LKKLEGSLKEVLLLDNSTFFNNLEQFNIANQENNKEEIDSIESESNNNLLWIKFKNILGILINNQKLKGDYKSYKKNLWKKELKNYSKEIIEKDLRELQELTEELKSFYYNTELIYEVLKNKGEIKKLHEGHSILSASTM